MSNVRIPPHSTDAEQATLGALLSSEKTLAQIADWLKPEDFYEQRHQVIYRAVLELAEKNKPYDAVTLGEWFETNGMQDTVGGAAYVVRLARAGLPGSVAAYAEIVREKSKLRELIDTGMEMAKGAWAPRADSSVIAAHASNRVGSLVGDARGGGLVGLRKSVSNWLLTLQQRFDKRETITGLRTPWSELNEVTQGLQPGDLIVVAGRSNMGKSVAGFQMATFNALAGKRTAQHSLEMRDGQFVQRGVAAFGRIKHRSLSRPADLTEADWSRVTEMSGKLSAAPLVIDDQGGLTAAQIAARVKREHLRAPLTLVVVDHLHAIKRTGRDMVQDLGDNTQAMKNLAKDLGVPVVLLAQLNRANTQRGDHRPTMADLRGSGAIEEIADVIFLLHREDYYTKNTHLAGVVELIIGKGRDIPTGETIYLKNRYDEMRLDDWEGELPTRKAAPKSEPRGFVPEDDQ
jgi:replicative DNA helicase